MSNYTLELVQLTKDPNFTLFDFDYEFYCELDEVKKVFEKKFIDHYLFNEIGFETIARFKQRLRSRLNLKMPYYKQLYYTELKSKDIDYLLNKDYTETYERLVDKVANGEGQSTSENSSVSKGNFKESSLDNGNANLGEGSLTTINDNGINNSDNGTLKNSSSLDENERESYTLTGKGNIGITSSAELLEKWRSVLINIDEMLIEEFYDLFMGVF